MLKLYTGTSLVVQWLRIHPLMQGTGVRSLVQEDPTCDGPAKPVHQIYGSLCAWSPMLCHKERNCSEKPVHRNERVAPARCS